MLLNIHICYCFPLTPWHVFQKTVVYSHADFWPFSKRLQQDGQNGFLEE